MFTVVACSDRLLVVARCVVTWISGSVRSPMRSAWTRRPWRALRVASSETVYTMDPVVSCGLRCNMQGALTTRANIVEHHIQGGLRYDHDHD